jgi:acetate kinase
MKILVLNAGSSSLKFHLYENEEQVVAGSVERVASWQAAIAEVFSRIGNVEIAAVGHRIVHGGDRFTRSVIIDAAVEQAIEELAELAPLHNPHNLEAYRATRERLPAAVHVAVFDTAFHQSLPPRAFAYGLPYEYLTGRKIRRYGFHGISHQYVSGRFAEVTGRPLTELRLISCHLGNGCSVCAIEYGRSVDTSMGFTPLEGLVMGTRCGDLDAGAVLHLIERGGMAPEDLAHTLNYESGLLGLSGTSNDMRDLLGHDGDGAADGDKRAGLAIDVFCYRVKKYLGAYLAAMNGADAIIFTAGIGENAPEIRERICAGLDELGIEVDPAANLHVGAEARQIGFSKIPVWVIPTNEELLIARDTAACVRLT